MEIFIQAGSAIELFHDQFSKTGNSACTKACKAAENLHAVLLR
jgi:hypothetical protein